LQTLRLELGHLVAFASLLADFVTPKVRYCGPKAETMSGSLNQKHGSSSRILIKAYVNCGLCSSNTLNGLKYRSRSQRRVRTRWIIQS